MLTETEIKENIEKLRNKIGDARTGGKGSQRRKVKVVAKQNVLLRILRLVMIRLWRTLSRK